jgi:hypothetical protein
MPERDGTDEPVKGIDGRRLSRGRGRGETEQRLSMAARQKMTGRAKRTKKTGSTHDNICKRCLWVFSWRQ